MKKIFLFIAIISFCSCVPKERSETEENIPSENTAPVKLKYLALPRGISVQIVDNCEYIYAESSHGVAIIHKENCKNHIR